MTSRLFVSLFLGIVFFLQTGCVFLEPLQEASRQTFRSVKPKGSDYRNLTEEESDEWDFVGTLGRGNQHREKDPDPWWKRYIMSEKARSIERNLGFD